MSKTLTLKTLDGRSFSGNVKNGAATLGSIAGRIASKAGLAGCFELIDEKNPDIALDPNTRLDEAPETIVMSPELTPAVD